jgi:Tol biopolymer transport system component
VVGAIEPLTSGPRDFQVVEVSPDGREMLLQTSPRTQEDLDLITPGASMRNLTNDQSRDRSPKWSADGRRVLFYSDRGGDYELWSIDRDGGALRQLTESGGRRYAPVPSPDGAKVVVTDINTWTLFMYDTSDFTKPLEELGVLPEAMRGGGFIASDWSRDGKHLTGWSAGFIWVYSFESRTFRQVTDGSSTAQWLPDSRRILTQRQGRMRIVDATSGEGREVLAIPGEPITASRLSPDGKFVYFLRGSSSGDIWTVRLEPVAVASSQ